MPKSLKNLLKNTKTKSCDEELSIASKKALYFLQSSRKFKYISFIARGSYGVVTAMYDHERSSPVAVKSSDDANLLELQEWPLFQHPNIVPLLDTISLDCATIFIMPLYRQDLWIVSESRNFYEDEISFDLSRLWFKDILRGLAYLHNKNIAHLDLKMDNIFVKDNGHVCIGDFSLMVHLNDVSLESLFLEHIQPPEFSPHYEEFSNVLRGDVVLRGDIVDIWQFGILILDFLTDRKLSVDKNTDYIVWKYDIFPYIKKVLDDKCYLEYLLKHCFTNKKFKDEEIASCKSLLKETLCLIPSKRTSAKSALFHPFVNVEWPLLPKPEGSLAVLDADKANTALRASMVEIAFAEGKKRISLRDALEAMMIHEESTAGPLINAKRKSKTVICIPKLLPNLQPAPKDGILKKPEKISPSKNNPKPKSKKAKKKIAKVI